MKAFLSIILALSLASSALASGSLTTLGAGSSRPSVTSTYVGVGDVQSGAFAYYSCARAYDRSYAVSGGNLCDLGEITGGAAVCTLKVLSTGFANLASGCNGTDPASACAAAAGGGCIVLRAYDQSGNSRDCFQSASGGWPRIAFSAINGLPAVQFDAADGRFCSSSGTFTVAQPITALSVAEITARPASGFSAYIGTGGTGATLSFGWGSTTNTATVYAGAGIPTQVASDSAWHAINAVANGASSVVMVDGSDGSTGSAGTGAFSNFSIRIGRGGTNVGATLTGSIAETMMYAAALNSTQRGNITTNQRSATHGYNF